MSFVGVGTVMSLHSRLLYGRLMPFWTRVIARLGAYARLVLKWVMVCTLPRTLVRPQIFRELGLSAVRDDNVVARELYPAGRNISGPSQHDDAIDWSEWSKPLATLTTCMQQTGKVRVSYGVARHGGLPNVEDA